MPKAISYPNCGSKENVKLSVLLKLATQSIKSNLYLRFCGFIFVKYANSINFIILCHNGYEYRLTIELSF